MTPHPETAEIFFVRHAPVVKRAGHVPPSDPSIIDQDYILDPLIAMLPRGADWHVSPFDRTRQTAALLAPHLEPGSTTEDDRLAEMEFGDWADRPVADVWNKIKDGPLHNWSFVTADTTPPGGTSFAELSRRVESWMSELAGNFTPAPRIVVTHAGVMRAVIGIAMAAQPDQVVGIPVPYFGVARLCLMDPQRATQAGGCWLFSGLADPQVAPLPNGADG